MTEVLLAGPEAQRKFNAKGFRQIHASADWEQARELLSYLSGSREILEAHLELVRLRAHGLVQLRWREIQAVAKAALKKHVLDRNDIGEAIRGSLPRGGVIRVVATHE